MMEHIVCRKCESEYDIMAVEAVGWRLIPHRTVCEVCGSVLKDWEKDRENILIMTKRGLVTEPA
jgi:transcription initiation factor TFIIIB Brf1 subunit/transcription initiation factor TFIIB